MKTALAEAKPFQPDDYFGGGQPFEATVSSDDSVYKISEGQLPVAPVDEDYLRILLVTGPEGERQPRRLLTLLLEQTDPSQEDEAHAEILVEDRTVAESPEVVAEVMRQVMGSFRLQEVVTSEEDVAGEPTAEKLDAGRLLAGAGFKEGETPGTYELRAAA